MRLDSGEPQLTVALRPCTACVYESGGYWPKPRSLINMSNGNDPQKPTPQPGTGTGKGAGTGTGTGTGSGTGTGGKVSPEKSYQPPQIVVAAAAAVGGLIGGLAGALIGSGMHH